MEVIGGGSIGQLRSPRLLILLLLQAEAAAAKFAAESRELMEEIGGGPARLPRIDEFRSKNRRKLLAPAEQVAKGKAVSDRLPSSLPLWPRIVWPCIDKFLVRKLWAPAEHVAAKGDTIRQSFAAGNMSAS